MFLLAPPPVLIDRCVERPSLRPAEERGDMPRYCAFTWEAPEAAASRRRESESLLRHKTHLAIVALDPDVTAPPLPELQPMP